MNRRMRRTAYVLVPPGVVLVFLAIFTDSKVEVAFGLSLLAIAHVLLFLTSVPRRQKSPPLEP